MIFFSFLPLIGPQLVPGAGGGGGAGGSLCQETLINGEEGRTRPRQGYGLENSVCVQYELIYIFVKAVQAERLFTFSQAADFCSRDRNQADSNLTFLRIRTNVRE